MLGFNIIYIYICYMYIKGISKLALYKENILFFIEIKKYA